MGAKANRCKNNQSVLSKQPAINVISEESSNISEDVFTGTNETNTSSSNNDVNKSSSDSKTNSTNSGSSQSEKRPHDSSGMYSYS